MAVRHLRLQPSGTVQTAAQPEANCVAYVPHCIRCFTLNITAECICVEHDSTGIHRARIYLHEACCAVRRHERCDCLRNSGIGTIVVSLGQHTCDINYVHTHMVSLLRGLGSGPGICQDVFGASLMKLPHIEEES